MKKALPFICSIFLFSLLSAQHTTPISITGKTIAKMLPQPSPLGEVVTPNDAISPQGEKSNTEVNIGATRFQLQSIGSLGRRVAVSPDGIVSAGWHFGDDQTGGWPDRGMAYNQFDGTAWGDVPISSVETQRSGYPSFTNTSNGLEVILSHKNTSASDWFLQSVTKMPSEDTWTETEIPSTVPGGPVWGKVATGGPDGNTIHAVAVSVDPMFGGSVYNGMDQHPLYYRSTDAGATWDKVDVIIPGLDSSFYSTISGEAYNIYANGETVAIGVFDSWGDVAVFKSVDNGENWVKTIVHDFPLDKYDGSGYDGSDIPFDPNAPDSITMYTTDGSGSVIVDDNGKVHVFFGTIYVFANGADRFLNLTTDGIAYWNEDRATDELDIIAEAVDYDDDDIVTVNGTFEQLRYNNTNFTSFPTSSIDEDGNLYLVYSSVREDLTDPYELTYRHIYMVKSTDGGTTWTDPADILDPDYFELYFVIEGKYPSIPARIGENIDLIYLQDLTPGVTPDTEPADDQLVQHIVVDKETFAPIISSDVQEIDLLASDVLLVPNPAALQTTIQFTSLESSEVHLRVYDLLGQLTYVDKLKINSGFNNLSLDVSEFIGGVYFVQLEIEGGTVSRKLVVE